MRCACAHGHGRVPASCGIRSPPPEQILLSLSKIVRIPIRLHRPLQGMPKTVTISKEADGWYACISCAEVPAQPLPLTGRETAIDVGLNVFLVTAEGEYVENPRHQRKAQK